MHSVKIWREIALDSWIQISTSWGTKELVHGHELEELVDRAATILYELETDVTLFN